MTDFLIIGAGVAGAAAGCFLARLGHVTLLEAEDAPGRHATGRSAALFSEYYGNSLVRALTRASRALYDHPPPGVTLPTGGVLRPRGVLALQTPNSDALFQPALESGADAPRPATEVDEATARSLYPPLRPGTFERALYRPGVCDIDTDAVHQGLLRALRSAGGAVITGARVTGLACRRGRWHASTPAGDFTAPVVVNAAGAWAGQVAGMAGLAPTGLVPRRRTAALASLPPGHDAAHWPVLCDLADTFYAKPESGGLLLSPSDDDPCPPGEPRPDASGIALAIDRYRAVASVDIRHVRRAWAGLRSSPPDDSPIVGPDPAATGFWWLAGLGGYGFQTAPALGTVLAALIAGDEPPPGLAALVPGLTPARPGAHPSAHSPPH